MKAPRNEIAGLLMGLFVLATGLSPLRAADPTPANAAVAALTDPAQLATLKARRPR